MPTALRLIYPTCSPLEAAAAVTSQGKLMLYGPFLKNGKHVSAGDLEFDTSLRDADPDIGYKDRDDVASFCRMLGLSQQHWLDMPANNLMLVMQRP